jgi:hypothetical protein
VQTAAVSELVGLCCGLSLHDGELSENHAGTSFVVKERLPAIVPARTRKITVRYVEQCACKIEEVPGSSAQCVTVKNYGEWNGAQGRNRTTDTAIFNRMLYQLSYLGAKSSNLSARVEQASRARAL